MLNPTPLERLLDPQGRPYFLWDCSWSDSEFREMLRDADPDVRAALIGKLMRQAKPDDVFLYITEADIRAHWERLQPHLGKTREFWTWILTIWSGADEG
jgi:hypothetical protein